MLFDISDREVVLVSETLWYNNHSDYFFCFMYFLTSANCRRLYGSMGL